MGAALVGGLLAAGRPPSSDRGGTEVAPARREQLAAMLPERARVRRRGAVRRGGAGGEAGDVAEAARAAVAAGARRLLSIAAGITTHAHRAGDRRRGRPKPSPWCGPCRTRPRSCGRGASAIAPGATAGADDLAWAEAILGAVGHGGARRREPTRRRHRLLSGSGPAYLFFVAEALIGGRRGGRPGTASSPRR